MFKFGKKKTTIIAPCAGNLIPLEEVADSTFAKKTVGDGFAIVPTLSDSVEFCAPIAGTVKKVFNNSHAFSILNKEGLEILIHIGLDTKHLAGDEFELLIEKGTEVEAGTPIVKVALAKLSERGIDLTTPVVFPDKLKVKHVLVTTSKTVTAAATIAEVVYS